MNRVYLVTDHDLRGLREYDRLVIRHADGVLETIVGPVRHDPERKP